MSETLPAGDILLAYEGIEAEKARAILARRTATIGRHGTAAPVLGAEVLVWTLGGESFALPLNAVAAVLPPQRINPVPGASPALLGIAVRRARLMNIVDPGPALGLPASDGSGGHLILLRRTAPRLALRVDRAERIVRLGPDQPPAAGGGLTRPALAADGAQVALLDKEDLIAALGLAGRPASQGE